MTNPENEPQFNRDEFTKIFDEYRARIEQITRQTEQNLRSIRSAPESIFDEEPEEAERDEVPEEATAEEAAVETSSEISESAAGETAEASSEDAVPETGEEKPDVAPAPPAYERPQPPVIPEQEKPVPESAKIIREAEKKAKKIIDEAEERAKKEAKKKVKSQAEKLLEKARQEADRMIAEAQEIVNREKNEAVAASKTQTEQLLREITEQFRRETQTRSAEAVSDAREKADELMTEVMNAGTEIHALVKTSLERVQATVTEFEARLQEETDSISRAIADVQAKIERMLEAARQPEYVPVPAGLTGEDAGQEPVSLPTLRMHVLGDRSNGKNGTQPLFFGKVEMKSESATFEYQHFKNLKKQFVKIPSIKQLQESASEKEMSALFDITEPLPLLEILSKMPSVSEVVSNTDRDISIIFSEKD